MTVYAAVFACLALQILGEDSYQGDLSRWAVTEAPRLGSERWLAASASEKKWTVFLHEGHPAVRALKEAVDDRLKLPFVIKQGKAREGLAGAVHATQVVDGWIVGFNSGEFGAGLWWFAPNGKSRYRISDAHARLFIQSSGLVLALEGLSHMGSDRGQIVQLTQGASGRWESDPFVDLGSAPRAVTRDKDGSLIIVATKRLARVTLKKQMVIIVDEAFWRGLYPNSVIIDGAGAVYIGMRGGVAKVTSSGREHTISWLVPQL